MEKIYFTEHDLQTWLHRLIRQMNAENWRPDYIVGLTRGGLIPAVMMSHYLELPMNSLKVSLRDSSNDLESNCWMAEDAFGYINKDETDRQKKKILIIDDINDTGATFNWIINDWQLSCLPNDPNWNDVWNNNVRFAVLVNNESSEFKNIDYAGIHINKLEKDVWCVFPWENWWESKN